MTVYTSISDVPLRRRAIAIGVFDGVHIGHRKIIGDLLAAREAGQFAAALVLSFDPHPLSVLGKGAPPRLLTSPGRRSRELLKLGVDEVLMLPFSRELAAMPYGDFTRDILVARLGIGHLVAGHDFHIGQGGDGSAAAMAKLGESLGFGMETAAPVQIGEETVSSSGIRIDLSEGRLDAVSEKLGRPWSLAGQVVEGSGRGRLLGFPTANLQLDLPDPALPPAGVYLVRVLIDGQRRDGLMNLGLAPTLRGSFCAEVHLIDRQEDLYGRDMQVEVLQAIRPERAFPDADSLAARISEDLKLARALLDDLNCRNDCE